MLTLIKRHVDSIEGQVRAEALSQLVGDYRAQRVSSFRCSTVGSPSSAGVLSSGQSTNGPAAKRSSVATISATYASCGLAARATTGS